MLRQNVELLRQGLDIEHVCEDEREVVKLTGELDMANARQLEDELVRIEADRRVEMIVLDLRDLSYVDSTGLDVLVRAARRIREHGQRLELIRASSGVHRVFELTGLDRILSFAE